VQGGRRPRSADRSGHSGSAAPALRGGGTSTLPFGFVGREQYQTDGDSGLMLLGHRTYDSSIGRFLTCDPFAAFHLSRMVVPSGGSEVRQQDPAKTRATMRLAGPAGRLSVSPPRRHVR
jgi:RHS repeat-associated protein